MRRLLQGDVGSGKTVVAVAALLTAVEAGGQGAIMAPTEVLAEQHYLSISAALADLPVNVVLLTGSQGVPQRRAALERISAGEAHVVVGTHALIQKGVDFRDLSLVVVDEQHRFGVGQRTVFREKGTTPDTLVMTATPIPEDALPHALRRPGGLPHRRTAAGKKARRDDDSRSRGAVGGLRGGKARAGGRAASVRDLPARRGIRGPRRRAGRRRAQGGACGGDLPREAGRASARQDEGAGQAGGHGPFSGPERSKFSSRPSWSRSASTCPTRARS